MTSDDPLWPPTSFNDLEWPWMTFDPRIEILFFTIFGEELMTSNDPQWPNVTLNDLVFRYYITCSSKILHKSSQCITQRRRRNKKFIFWFERWKKTNQSCSSFYRRRFGKFEPWFDPNMTPFDPVWLHLAESFVILASLTPFDLYGLIWLHLTYWPYMASFDLIWPYLTS